MKSMLVAAALTLAASVTFAGPFGLEMGTPLSQLDVEEGGPRPFLKSVPKPHPEFVHYFVWAPEKTGVCFIGAFSKEYSNDRYGSNIRIVFDRFTAALDKKYGEHESVDHLKAGAIWNEPNDWVMSIKQNERTYSNYWDNPKGGADENLDYIEMKISAYSSDSAVIILQYRSNDVDECHAAITAGDNEAF